MNKLIMITLLSFATTSQAFFGFFPTDTTTTSESCTCTDVNNTSTNIALINGNTEVSQQLLVLSLALLEQSQMMLSNANMVNTDYVQAMLQLSTDIGSMADRIGEMADRIVATEELIGDMADRIVLTQQIQSQNLDVIQQNILKAQENFNTILLMQ